MPAALHRLERYEQDVRGQEVGLLGEDFIGQSYLLRLAHEHEVLQGLVQRLQSGII